MDLLQLRYFQVVARLENMTRSAEELHISQPSLSKTIARLEEQVGVPLFERQGRSIRLNQFGKVFLSRVNRSLRELDDGCRELDDLAGREKGSVTVGSATARLLPNLICGYLTAHPHVKFRLLQVAEHWELQSQLNSGEIDFSISSLAISQDGLHCEPLIQEEISLAVPPAHRLSGRTSIRFNEIADDPLIYYTTECGLREIINRFCRQAEFTPNIAFECTTPEVICGLVEAGLGIAFLPEYLWFTAATNNLVKLHLEQPACHRSIWLSWMEDRYLSVAARDFKEFVMRYFLS